MKIRLFSSCPYSTLQSESYCKTRQSGHN